MGEEKKIVLAYKKEQDIFPMARTFWSTWNTSGYNPTTGHNSIYW